MFLMRFSSQTDYRGCVRLWFSLWMIDKYSMNPELRIQNLMWKTYHFGHFFFIDLGTVQNALNGSCLRFFSPFFPPRGYRVFSDLHNFKLRLHLLIHSFQNKLFELETCEKISSPRNYFNSYISWRAHLLASNDARELISKALRMLRIGSFLAEFSST